MLHPDIETEGGGTLVAIGNTVHDNCTGNVESTGDAYDFFNPNDFYDYQLNPAEGLEDIITQCAGPSAELGMK